MVRLLHAVVAWGACPEEGCPLVPLGRHLTVVVSALGALCEPTQEKVQGNLEVLVLRLSWVPKVASLAPWGRETM